MTKPNLKAAQGMLLVTVGAAMLTACNSSSTQEQIAWIEKWDSFAHYDQKLEVIEQCFKQAKVRSLMDDMTDRQSQVYNACTLELITKIAEGEGVYLEKKVLQANIVQF
ncbi:hypothetical protein [Vibrio hippocampi]|uniref:Lipoprotein n=1 Tax=Vibrio hippocampi TaxID=654686 RepID=A0ABN8DJT2_9VIBR|nr:hypothetical protein [Vibrio hippocampi]CAH0526217.1 hypothetical protein VHP8226_01689 [Vibrio hippocampi]